MVLGSSDFAWVRADEFFGEVERLYSSLIMSRKLVVMNCFALDIESIVLI